MIKTDFYGNDFVWWTGIVEDRKDPLKVGRIRVRIIGLHPFDDAGKADKTLVPTEKLPWAQIVLSTYGTKTISGPKEGDWVFGFFQDGRSGQIPIVIGTYSGVEGKEAINITYTDVPKPPNNIIVIEETAPTTPRISRGVIEGTLVNKTNQERSQVCDITQGTKGIIAKTKLAFSTIIESIRNFIRGLLASLGLDPSGVIRTIIRLAKAIISEIRKLSKIFTLIQTLYQVISGIIQKVTDMISYILSLPLKVLKFIINCLTGLTSSLGDQLLSIINIPGIDVASVAAISGLAGNMGAISTVLNTNVNGISVGNSLSTASIGSFLNQTNISNYNNSSLSLNSLINTAVNGVLNNTNGTLGTLSTQIPTSVSTLQSSTIQNIMTPTSRNQISDATNEFSTFIENSFLTQSQTTETFYFNSTTYPGP